jgi:hypothetical protein
MTWADIDFTTTPRKTVNDPRTSCRIAKHFRADHTIAFALRGDAARAAETHGKTEKQKAKDHDPVQGFGSSPQERASLQSNCPHVPLVAGIRADGGWIGDIH